MKNIISMDDLSKLLFGWNDHYGIKQSHGSVTFVELKKEFKVNDLTMSGELMEKLQKYYPYLTFEFDNQNNKLLMNISVRKDSLPSFFHFKTVLRKVEEKWKEEGVIAG
ncbi:hypothetical protein [Cytobacillus sp. IB215665]|uniref:hypothetical protein n=1 Tax=Cytobacillus sp. IB215665 TaxID=3097357 RepID=UPI002A0D35BF|nr:hypothetical protein [Cytobacillus sp. IB215665]MDX8367190.1 hypothetical protein [Cytobacillus sp. IB215665]